MAPPHTTDPPLTGSELGAWRGLLRVHAALAKQLDADLEDAHELPLSSYDVLTTLEDQPERRMRMCDLADAVVLSRSGLTRLVDRLAKDGLIERAECKSDARGAYAVLTERGAERIARARPLHQEGIRRLFLRHFSEDELGLFAEWWERVLPGASD